MPVRSIGTYSRRMAKNDSSTIDSYRLPSQTSISEWEFQYDFVPKVSDPKVPPISEDAVKQDIAQERKKQVEQEMLNQEVASSIKVEGNDSVVMRGGENVKDEPELIQDRGSKPIKVNSSAAASTSGKPANREQYLQTSANPHLNQTAINNLSEAQVDHKQEDASQPSPVVDDLDHDNMNHSGQKVQGGSNNVFFVTLGVFGLGAGSFYYMNQAKK